MCTGQHDGANTGNTTQQHVTNVQRQCQQHRVPYPAIGIAHAVDGCHHRRVSIGNCAVNAVDFGHFRHHRFEGAGEDAGPCLQQHETNYGFNRAFNNNADTFAQ